MAEPAELGRDPLPWLRRSFEGAARGLRWMGPRRYTVADALGMAAYAMQPPRKRRLAAHLHSRAAAGLPAEEARRRARASYREYSRMILDTLWIHAYGLDELWDHGEIFDLHHFVKARAEGRGAILTLVHFGSWDTAASLALAAGYSMSSVMAPVGPRAVTDLLAWSRRVKQMTLYTPRAAARGLLRALRAGEFVALLVDIPEGGPTTVVDFCGGPVRFSVGPSFLARATGAPIIPVDCWRGGRGYQVQVHQPMVIERDQRDQEVMQRVAAILEPAVQRRPEQWYPFNQIYVDEMEESRVGR